MDITKTHVKELLVGVMDMNEDEAVEQIEYVQTLIDESLECYRNSVEYGWQHDFYKHVHEIIVTELDLDEDYVYAFIDANLTILT